MAEPHKMSSGVQELITRLKDEGVKAGRDEAERMVTDAQEKAAQIIAKAKTDAESLMATTRTQLENEKKDAKASLKTAIRDTELMLESELKAGFAEHVKHLVSVELQDKEFLKKIIAAVIGRSCPELAKQQDIEVLIPKDLFESGEKGPHITNKGKDQLHHFVLGVAGEMLRDGVQIKMADGEQVGLKIRMVGDDVEIDLTDNAISSVLLKYLLPRYRAILSGTE